MLHALIVAAALAAATAAPASAQAPGEPAPEPSYRQLADDYGLSNDELDDTGDEQEGDDEDA